MSIRRLSLLLSLFLNFSYAVSSPLKVEMAPYYEEFDKKGTVRFYFGMGAEHYYSVVNTWLYENLKNMAGTLGITGLSMTGQIIKFRDSQNLKYSVEVGDERNAFMEAFSKNEIVMYFGHSRSGRGPAFQKMDNYFRMGNVFSFLEVDATNPYFLKEPILHTEAYPVKSITLGNQTYSYQYQGQKDASSALSQGAYVKRIAGFDADWKKTKVLSGKQIFWILSCANMPYFQQPIRKLFPDPQEKLVFGTEFIPNPSVREAVAEASRFIKTVVRRVPSSDGVLEYHNYIDTVY